MNDERIVTIAALTLTDEGHDNESPPMCGEGTVVAAEVVDEAVCLLAVPAGLPRP